MFFLMDPDEMPRSATIDLGVHCFQSLHHPDSNDIYGTTNIPTLAHRRLKFGS